MTSLCAKAAAGVLLIALVLGVLFGVYHRGEALANAQWQAKWDKEVAKQAKAKSQAEEAARAEESRRINSNQQAQAHAIQSTAVAETDAVAATASTGRVQLAAAKLATEPGSCTGHPTVAAGSPPTNHAAMVLSDLLSRANQRAAELAAFADKSRIAGLACEQSYDGIRVNQK